MPIETYSAEHFVVNKVLRGVRGVPVPLRLVPDFTFVVVADGEHAGSIAFKHPDGTQMLNDSYLWLTSINPMSNVIPLQPSDAITIVIK